MIDTLNTWGTWWAGYFGAAVLQNTLFLVVLILVLRAMRNAPAGLRYALCIIGLAKLLLPPFLPAGFMQTPDGVAPVASLVSLSSAAPSHTAGYGVEHAPAPHLNLAGLAFGVWVTIAVGYLALAALSVIRLRRKLKSAVSLGLLDDGPGPGKQIEVLKTDAVPVPLTFGFFRPKIYVPEAWQDWGEGCRAMVLAHELAHIRRWDRLGQALQVALKAFYLFHPLVWLLDRRISRYREMACDDEAIAKTASGAADYSHHLVEVAERAVFAGVSWRSVSPLVGHRKGLLDRVRYQLEVKDMKSTSHRTRSLILAGLMLLVLPLSWYCGKAGTDEAGATVGQEAPKTMKEVTVVLSPGGKMAVDGEAGTLRELARMLRARFPSGRDKVLVRLMCEDGVAMERITQVHETLVDLDLRKVIYEGPPEEGLPLILPSFEDQEKLAALGGEHVTVLKVDLPGHVVLDGEPMKLTEVKQAISDRLAEDPHLVVSLAWAPTARYEDFLMVLELAKAAGAERISVQIGA